MKWFPSWMTNASRLPAGNSLVLARSVKRAGGKAGSFEAPRYRHGMSAGNVAGSDLANDSSKQKNTFI